MKNTVEKGSSVRGEVVQQGLARVVGLGEILLAQHVVEHRVLQPFAGVAHPAALNSCGHPYSRSWAAKCCVRVALLSMTNAWTSWFRIFACGH